jgi:hypothetical protein
VTIVGLFAQGGALPLFAAAVILIGAVIETAYLFRLISSFYLDADDDVPHPPAHGRLDLLTAGVLSAALIAAVVLLQPLSQRLVDLSSQAADRDLYIRTVQPTLPSDLRISR